MRCGEDKNAISDANGKLESTFNFLNYIYNLFVFFFMNVSDFYTILQNGGAYNTALSSKNGIFCCCKQRRRNQQRNKQKTRKCASDIKKPKNVDVLTKTAKRNAL